MFLSENICCDPSLEPSWQDGSYKGLQCFIVKTCCDPSLEPSWQDGSNKGLQHFIVKTCSNERLQHVFK